MLQPAHRLARRLVVLALAASTVIAVGPAAASHYRFPASGLVTKAEHTAFAGVKIDTTRALMRQASSVAARAKLAERTGISLERLEELSCQVDLLRVSGVGPTMVKLIQASGILHTRALRAESGEALATKLKAINDAQSLVPVLPSAATLSDWIKQAKGLKQTLELSETGRK